MAVKASRTNE